MRLKLPILLLVVIIIISSLEYVIAGGEILRLTQNDRWVGRNDGGRWAQFGGENAQPDITFENSKFNFGKICKGEKAEHLFKFTNQGNGKLIIHQVKTTCVCTAASADLKEIGPGDSGVIRVTYTADNNKTGPFKKAVIVVSNDMDIPHYALLISGEVVDEVIVEPKYIDFGVVPWGESSAKSLKLGIGNDARPFAEVWVTGVECDSPHVTATHKETGNNEYIIEASFKAVTRGQGDGDKVQGNIVVLTKGLKQSRIKLPFYGRVEGGPPPDTGKDKTFAIVFTGEEEGYLEPCGCSENQLGGIPKRHTLITSINSGDGAQDSDPFGTKVVIPVSLGDLSAGFSRQDEIKVEIFLQALDKMGYVAHNIGERDITLGPEMLNSLYMENRLKFLSSNVRCTDYVDSRIRSFIIKHVEVGESRPYKIGFLGVLSPQLASTVPSYEFKVMDPVSSLRPLIGVLKDRVDMLVLLSHAEMDESVSLAETFPELDLIISGHGVDDPPDYEPVYVNDGASVVVSAGNKGKYAGLYRYSPSEEECDVEIIPVSSDYTDSPEMRELMQRYLQMVKDEDLLADEPKFPTPSGDTYTGSNTCGICHTEIYKHWETTTHATAYETLVKSEHDYDPDCVPCHVTGFQYDSGFESVEVTPALRGVGCEDCHGPGSAHIDTPDAEYGKTTPPHTCATCHVPDHSPKFEYNPYWEKITHPEDRISGLGG